MRPIDADVLDRMLQERAELMGDFSSPLKIDTTLIRYLVKDQPTLDVVPAIQERDSRDVVDGLKDLIADRRSFAQEPDDIFSRDIQILESAIALIQPMASRIQKHTEK